MEHVIVGLGSNLSQPKDQIKVAIDALQAEPCIDLIAQSSIYRSSPQGPQDQDDFYNAVVLIATALSPLELLITLQNLEQLQGKIKRRHWGERVIDLDIIFYGQQNVNNRKPSLVIPHPYALERDFVIVPILEIAPEWLLPNGTLLSGYQHTCLNHNLNKID